jgi:hypothetical protein
MQGGAKGSSRISGESLVSGNWARHSCHPLTGPNPERGTRRPEHVVEFWPSMHKALDLVPTIEKKML